MLMNDLKFMAPELFLTGAVLLLTLIGAMRGDRVLSFVVWAAILACALTIGECVTNPDYWARSVVFNGLYVIDSFATTIKIACLSGVILVLMMVNGALQNDRIARFECPILILTSVLGMMVMVSANHFIAAYMGVELSALALYVLAAFQRDSVLSSESGMKYFVLGALSSGILLFGISLVYGFTGSLSFDAIHTALTGHPTAQQKVGSVVGMAFILAGLAFKISAVPFHMWTPDVYQGAPGSVTAFFATVPKVAALALLIRVLMYPFVGIAEDWGQIVAFLALASMMWGAFAAVAQDNIKRLLAYGSIGNMGYALMGVLAATPEGLSAALLYMFVYMAMTAGLFAVLLSVRRGDGEMVETMDDFAGLSQTHPVPAYLIAVMMFSMAGIPPLAGFFSKLMVFQAVVAAGYITVAVVGVLTSVVAAYYYLRVIRIMFFDAPRGEVRGDMSFGQQMASLVGVLGVLFFVFAPGPFYTLATHAVAGLTSDNEKALALQAASIMPAAGGDDRGGADYPPMPDQIPNTGTVQ